MSTAVKDERSVSSEVDAFAEKVMAAALGWVDLMAIHLGSQAGWYDALAKAGPMDAEELAVGTGTSRRYAQEWLEQQKQSSNQLKASARQEKDLWAADRLLLKNRRRAKTAVSPPAVLD